jgi:cytidine deaminase
VSEGATPIVALALAFLDAPSGSPAELKMPCGACRQVMAEFADGEMVLLIDGAPESTLGEIFPRPFRM